MANPINTNRKISIAESKNNKLPEYKHGRLIITDDGRVFYDKTTAPDKNPSKSDNRIELDVNNVFRFTLHPNSSGIIEESIIINTLNSISNPKPNDLCVIDKDFGNRIEKVLFSYIINEYNYFPEGSDTSEWVKLTESNGSSDSVTITKDLETTFDIGPGDLVNGKKVLSTNGITLTKFLESVLIKEKNPIVMYPNVVDLQVTFRDVANNIRTSFEYGETIYYTIEGKGILPNYEFGPDTNINANIVFGNPIISGRMLLTGREIKTFPLTENINVHGNFIASDDLRNNFTIELRYNEDVNSIPKTNLQNNVDDLRIRSNNKRLLNIDNLIYEEKLFYNWYYRDPIDISSISNVNDFIKSKNGDINKSEEITIVKDTTTIILASPFEISKIFNKTAGVDMIDCFTKSESTFNYGNKKLNMYIYSPAEPYEKTATLEIYFER